MARIRSIKPRFFRHRQLYLAEKETGHPLRVAFAGLWTCADREGRFRWEPDELKLDCLPYDEIDFSFVLDALSERGFIRKYTIAGIDYGFIPSWQNHQHVNAREAESQIPPPPENGTHVTAPVTHVHAHGEQEGKGTGREGKGTDARAVWLCKEVVKIYSTAELLQTPDTGRCFTWVAQGYDPHLIVPVIAERIQPGKPFKPLQYFDKIIAEAHAIKDAPKANGRPVDDGIRLTHFALLDHEANTGNWNSKRISKAEIPAETIAQWESQRASN